MGGRSWNWLILDASMCMINMLLHGIGLLLLLGIYRKDKKGYRLILIHFALSELCINTVHFVKEACDIAIKHDGRTPFLKEFRRYIQFFRNIGFMLQSFSLMFMVTADRLLAVKLTSRYPAICTVRNVKIALAITWAINMSAMVISCIYYACTGERAWVRVFYMYIDVTLGICFLLFAIATYGYILVKYTNTNMRGIGGNASWKTRGRDATWGQRAVSIVRDTNYSVTVWLVLAFLLLNVIPDITYTVLKLNKIKNYPVFVYISISKLLSDTVEAIVYIFLLKPIRRLLRRHMYRICLPWLYISEDTLQSAVDAEKVYEVSATEGPDMTRYVTNNIGEKSESKELLANSVEKNGEIELSDLKSN